MSVVEIFPWNENLNTGVTIIDEQHKKLVDILNRLASNLVKKSTESLLESTLEELSDYTIYHFETEEHYWSEHFDDANIQQEHKHVHESFIQKIAALKVKHQTMPIVEVAEDTLEFLTNWLASHILQTDREMAFTADALKDGLDFQDAKIAAKEKMNDTSHIFIEIILSIYSALSKNTLMLIKELKMHDEFDESQQSLRLAANVFKHTREGIMITSSKNKIIQVNKAVTEITGYTQEELFGKNPKVLGSGKNSVQTYKEMWNSINEKDYWSGEIWNRHKSGALYAEMLTINIVRDEQGEILNHIALFADITALKEHEGKLEYIAHYDSLTGLPNRLLLADRLKIAIAQTQRKKTSIAIVFLDLDGFKEINDTYGHDFGDRVLSALSKRMQKALRSDDTLARIGGDEFVVVLTDLHSHADSLPLLDRLLESVSEVQNINDKKLSFTASLGVSFFDYGDTTEPDQLLRQADQAMYKAKLAGKNCYHIFDSIEDASIRIHHQKISSIREALKRNEFELFYQPKVNMKKGEVVGFEALIRWRDPEKGVLSPALFLPFIEKDEMSITIGEWVIDEACKQIAHFKEQKRNYTISVNINAIHLLKSDFVHNLAKILKKYPTIAKGDLMIEILETSTLEDLERVSQIINDAEELGVKFALDDFGTGYSSLAYLKKLAVQEIKIDQSFIRDMLIDSDDLAIIEGVTTLSSAFHRQIIAEGVESVAHGEMLLQLGCEFAQGYAIAKPMPAYEIDAWLSNYKPQKSWQNTKRLQRDKIIYLHAIVQHRAWFQKMFKYLEDHQGSEIELSTSKCSFGIWLHNHPDQHQKRFKILHATHNELHAMASELSLKKLEHRAQELEHFRAKSEELIEQLKEMSLT